MAAPAPDPTQALSTETQADSPSTVLDVNVDLGESDDAIVGERLLTEATSALAAEHVDVVQGAAPSKVSVDVSWDAEDNHVITIRVTNRGEATQSLEGSPFVCEGCNENDIIAMLREVVPGCVPLLPKPQMSSDGPAGPDDGPGPSDGGDERQRKPLRGLGKAGIALMVVGTGAAIGGGVMLGIGEKDATNSGDPSQPDTTDFRPPGIGLLAAGGVVLLTGIGLLVADRLRANRRAVSVAPVFSPRLTGLSFSTRF